MRRTTRTTTASTAAVLYLRVSTDEQVQEGVSLAAQAAKLQAYCALRGLTVVDVVCDAGVSGGKPLHTREGGSRVLEMVKCGTVGHVVSYKLDRLFRDCANCLTVTADWDKKGVALHLVDLGGQTLDTSSAMGRFFLTVMAGAAELERNLIAERTKEAMGYKKSQHERISGHIPFGKTLAADSLHLVDDPAEQTIIAAAKTYYAAGLSLRAVAARLAAESYRSRTGNAFTAQAIKNMVEEVA